MGSFTELSRLATQVATTAGELILKRRIAGVSVAASKSSLEDVVTPTDREAEVRIRSMLSDARPQDGFLGEESGKQSGTSGLTWVVDPIDGTVNFLYGIAHFAVSIAVVEGEPEPLTWRALAASVYDPSVNELFSAVSEEGSLLNGKEIRVSEPSEFGLSLIATGFSYRSEIRAEQIELLTQIVPKVRDIRRMGSAALDLCSVASGRLNGYFERELKPWDHAGAALIAREAGASVSGITGQAPDERMLIASSPGIHDQLRTLILGN